MSNKNIYFTILAKSKTDAEAVAEAYKIAKEFDYKLGVEVFECGTQYKICRVSKDGEISKS